MKLAIELIPATAWCSNVRTQVPKSQWDKIRRLCYAKANYRCEICGGVGKQHPVECHEIWSWEQGGVGEHIQRLTGLIALCPTCHRVKHIGRVEVMEPHLLGSVLDHFVKVNGLNTEQTIAAISQAYETWRVRSTKKWTLDTSFLTTYS